MKTEWDLALERLLQVLKTAYVVSIPVPSTADLGHLHVLPEVGRIDVGAVQVSDARRENNGPRPSN